MNVEEGFAEGHQFLARWGVSRVSLIGIWVFGLSHVMPPAESLRRAEFLFCRALLRMHHQIIFHAENVGDASCASGGQILVR